MRTPFFGPYSVSRSTNFADNQLINLFPELIEGRTNGKDAGVLYLTPGLSLAATIGTGPIWGAHVFGGVLYVVSGSSLYSVSPSLSPTLIGSLGTVGGPVTILDNGFQVGVWALGLWVYTPSTGVFAQVPLPFPPNGQAVELDGFVIAAQVGLPELWQSNLLDMTTWNALNFASEFANSEPIVGLAEIHREIYVFKQTVTGVWINAGTQGFAFSRLDGAFIEVGLAAPRGIAQVGDTLIFPGRNAQGAGTILQLRSYSPQQISTHGLEVVLQSYSQLTDMIAYAYQQDDHHFYVLNSPSGDATWAYDSGTSTRAKEPLWHRRAAFANGVFHRHPGQIQVFFNGMSLIGDYQNGNLYQYVPGLALDNGQQRKWLRSWRALPRPSEPPVRFASLRIDMQTGIGVPDGSDPLVILRYSDDGGHRWSKEWYAHAGKPGRTAHRVKFNRLGSTRRNSGLDRIFELSSADVFPAALIGAELE